MILPFWRLYAAIEKLRFSLDGMLNELMFIVQIFDNNPDKLRGHGNR